MMRMPLHGLAYELLRGNDARAIIEAWAEEKNDRERGLYMLNDGEVAALERDATGAWKVSLQGPEGVLANVETGRMLYAADAAGNLLAWPAGGSVSWTTDKDCLIERIVGVAPVNLFPPPLPSYAAFEIPWPADFARPFRLEAGDTLTLAWDGPLGEWGMAMVTISYERGEGA